MSLINDLALASTDKDTLDEFIADNFAAIYDFFTWRKDEELTRDLHELKEYMTRKRKLLLSLTPNPENLAFLSLLLEVAERLSFAPAFDYLYKHLVGSGYQVASRLHASAAFLNGLDTADEYIDSYDNIHHILENALAEEEDSIDKVLITIVNYYLKAIADFPFDKSVALAICDKIKNSIAADEYSFLDRPVIWDLVNTDLTDKDFALAHIHQRLDEFLKRDKTETERAEGELLETGTAYEGEVDRAASSFDGIRQLSVNHYRICGSERVFRSLERGVGILKEECQLFGYMNSFGPMHYNKLLAAFENLPAEVFEKPLNILDWGCGQAMASMVLQEYCQENDIQPERYRSLLIEPSALALKRGALHLRKFDPDMLISTVNRDLDSLTTPDFDYLHGSNFLHLFSNILDIDLFSLTDLISLIKDRCKGDNYFVIVSPFVNDTKRSRIDAFVNAFTKYPGFELLSRISNRRGEWLGDWTRIERVFKVTIN